MARQSSGVPVRIGSSYWTASRSAPRHAGDARALACRTRGQASWESEPKLVGRFSGCGEQRIASASAFSCPHGVSAGLSSPGALGWTRRLHESLAQGSWACGVIAPDRVSCVKGGWSAQPANKRMKLAKPGFQSSSLPCPRVSPGFAAYAQVVRWQCSAACHQLRIHFNSMPSPSMASPEPLCLRRVLHLTTSGQRN